MFDLASFWDETVLLITAGASLILAVAVYSRAPDRVWNRLFALQATGVSLWVLNNYLIQVSATEAEAGFWLRVAHPIAAFVICTHVDLFWIFPDKTRLVPWPRRALLYSIGLLASLVVLAPNFYVSLEFAQGTVMVVYGWPFLIFVLFATATIGYADYLLFSKRRRLRGVPRMQVNYVLTGMLLCQMLSLFTILIFPLIFQSTYYSRWGAAGYIFVVGFTAYAIAKHHLVRPLVALARTAAFGLTGLVLALLMGLRLYFIEPQLMTENNRYLFHAAGGFLIGLIALPLYSWLRQRLEYALPGAQLAQNARQASEILLRTLDSQQLAQSLVELIQKLFAATYVAFYLREATEVFSLQAQQMASALPTAPPLPQHLNMQSLFVNMARLSHDLLQRSQIRRFFTLERAERLLEEMRQLEVELVAPLLWENELKGLLLVGEHLAGDIYSAEELQMLRNLLPQISLALHNAELFDGVVQLKVYYENIVRQMQSGVIAVHSTGTISMCNPAAENILGRPAQELLGHSLESLPAPLATRFRRALNGMPGQSGERLEIQRPNGEMIAVTCSFSRWTGTPLVQDGAIAVFSDLSVVEALEKERHQAEHLQFIRLLTARMAHEIRNPLVTIRTFAELLPDRWEDREFRQNFLATAQEEIARIERLLNNMLMLSKPADTVVEAINVDQVCESVLRAMSAAAEARHIRLEANLSVGKDRLFYGDRNRLHQALVNLVKNAIEAEPEGGRVCLKTTPTIRPGERQPLITITVHNDHSYIPEEERRLIFQPFYTQREDGTGLGLPVCQTIIEEHKGTISVRSSPEEGTSFIVELPLEVPTASHDHRTLYRM